MVPDAGEKFYTTSTLRRSEEVATQYREREREKQLASQAKVTLDNFAQKLAEGQTKELRVVLKADVQGSIDVLRKSLSELGNQEVTVRVLHAAVGGITESDVLLADASDAIVIGFYVVAPPAVRDIAEQRHVDIRLYRIIYDLTDDIRKALEGLLTPETKEKELGQAEVRQVFKVSKVGSVAGCLVTEGVVQRSARMRLVRNGVIVTDNREIESLRRVKEDAREVRAGTECGIRLTGFEDIKVGDTLVCFEQVTVARKLG
jgi:translation initiation factor IF-2